MPFARSGAQPACGRDGYPVRRADDDVQLAGRVPQEGVVRQVTQRRAISVLGGPFLEVVEATPKAGVWAADDSHSTSFLSCAVDDVAASGTALAQAGMTRVAASGDAFAVTVTALDISRSGPPFVYLESATPDAAGTRRLATVPPETAVFVEARGGIVIEAYDKTVVDAVTALPLAAP